VLVTCSSRYVVVFVVVVDRFILSVTATGSAAFTGNLSLVIVIYYPF